MTIHMFRFGIFLSSSGIYYMDLYLEYKHTCRYTLLDSLPKAQPRVNNLLEYIVFILQV